jgi:hypothetical protein
MYKKLILATQSTKVVCCGYCFLGLKLGRMEVGRRNYLWERDRATPWRTHRATVETSYCSFDPLFHPLFTGTDPKAIERDRKGGKR